MQLDNNKTYRFTARVGDFTQDGVGQFSGFVTSGGKTALRFLVKPWILHQEIMPEDIISIEETEPTKWTV